MKFDPTTRTRAIADPFDRIFNRSIADFVGTDAMASMPSVNVQQIEGGFSIELAAPGLAKEDFNISIDKNRLVISVERTRENDETTPTFTRREFNYDKFARSFFLPKTIDRDAISAAYESGILNVTLPKKEEVVKQEKVRTIAIS